MKSDSARIRLQRGRIGFFWFHLFFCLKEKVEDNIQSTRGLFDQNRASLGAFEFTPYGEDYTSAAPVDVTKRFTGLDLDVLTGQYYAPYCYYDPNLARWLTRDPLGMHDGPNVYSYVLRKLLTGLDALGLKPSCIEELIDAIDTCLDIITAGLAFYIFIVTCMGGCSAITATAGAIACVYGCLLGAVGLGLVEIWEIKQCLQAVEDAVRRCGEEPPDLYACNV